MDFFKYILKNIESMIIAMVLLGDILYTYLETFPYYRPNVNFATISIISCTLYQIILTFFFNAFSFNNRTAWLICILSSIIVLPVSYFYAKIRYNKLMNNIYTTIHDKKILQKKQINKEYIATLDNNQLIESMEEICMFFYSNMISSLIIYQIIF